MASTIKVKRSTGSAAPSSLAVGELAYSETAGAGNAGVFYYGSVGGSVIPVGGAGHFATLNSPALTGTPTSTTASSSDNSTRIATTAYVKAQGYAVASGVSAGTYTKVTVNSSGVVTVGDVLVAADIPTLTSAKISDFDSQVRTSRLNQMAVPNATVSFNNQVISNLGDPSSQQDAVNLRTLEARINGMDNKTSCRVTIGTNVTLSGGAPSSVGGISLSVNDRVLVRGQSTASQNGIYIVQTVGTGSNGTWVRATDADIDAEVTSGLYVWITEGSPGGNTGWSLTTADPITLGVTSLTFQQVTGIGTITAGPGLGQNVSEFYVKIGTAGSPAGYSYTAGAIVYCSSSSALNAVALTGIVQGNGGSAPTAVTGTANTLVKWTGTGATIGNSLISDNGTTVTVNGGIVPGGTFNIGATGSVWNQVWTNILISTAGTGTSGAVHWALRSGPSGTNRWNIGLLANESTGNAGSNFTLWRYDDTGANIGVGFVVNRATGNFCVGEAHSSVRFEVYGPNYDSSLPANQWSVDSAGTPAVNMGGGIGFGYLYNGTDIAIGALIQGAKENATSGNYATALRIFTRANGSTASECARFSSAGLLGLGSTNPQGVIDLGSSSAGRSIVWAGSTGTAWNTSIGSSHTSSALGLLSVLKFDASADRYLVSANGVAPHAGIRLGGTSSGDIIFFSEGATNRSVGDVFDYAAATRWTIQGSDGALVGKCKISIDVGTTPGEAAAFTIGALGANGTRDSHWLSLTGQSYDGSAHARSWAIQVGMTNNNGNGELRFLTKLDAGGYTTKVAWDESGTLVTGIVDGGTY